MTNRGLENEMQIMKEIDKRRIKKMSPPIQNLLYKMFEKVNQFKMLRAYKCGKYDKADLQICLDDVSYGVSIKCNSARIVHACYVKNLILFLRRYKISETTQKIILLYHYGDGTLDGKGKVRLDSHEVSLKLFNLIQKANIELNSNKTLVSDFVEMCLFLGTHSEGQKADFIYHGNLEYGYACSKDDIKHFLQIKSFSYMKVLHIGPITIHPYARYVDFKDTNPKKRDMIQCEWPNLSRDLEYISNGYRY